MFKGKSFYRRLEYLLWIFLSFGLFSCGGESPEGEVEDHEEQAHEELSDELVELSPEAIQQGNIQIEESKRIELLEYLEATGVVSPDESRVAHIRPLARGVVETVHVHRGDRVRKGQSLILYDNIELGEMISEFLSQQAQLQRHLAELEVTRKFWERSAELLEVQAIARKEVELREAQYKNAEAMVGSQRSEIAKSEEKLHRFGLSEKEIRALDGLDGLGGHRTASHNTLSAPFSGVIIDYDVAEGELVEPARELMTLADVSTVWVLVDVYEKDLGQIRESQNVEIVSPAYPDETFQGRLTYISDVLEKETRTARVRCVVSNPDRQLKLEMFVTARIPTIRKKTAVAIPEQAIQEIDGKDTVFVVEEPGHFRSVAIETGLKSEGWIEVKGMDPGVPVVANGSFHLKSILKRSEIQADDD